MHGVCRCMRLLYENKRLNAALGAREADVSALRAEVHASQAATDSLRDQVRALESRGLANISLWQEKYEALYDSNKRMYTK